MEMTVSEDKKVQEKDENQDPNGISFRKMIEEKRRIQREKVNELQGSPAGRDF